MTPEWVDRLYRCTSCERCMEVCQTQIPLVPLWEAARARTVAMGLGPMPAHVRLRNAVAKYANPYGEPLEKQRGWMLPGMNPAGKGGYSWFSAAALPPTACPPCCAPA